MGFGGKRGFREFRWFKGVMGLVLSLALLNGLVLGQAADAAAAEQKASPVEVEQAAADMAELSEEQAISVALEKFPELKKGKLSNAMLEKDVLVPGDALWIITWQLESQAKKSEISVAVNGRNGNIARYYNSAAALAKASYPTKVTEGQASKLAKQFIMKAVPTIKENALIEYSIEGDGFESSLFYPVLYSFEYEVKVNGYLTDSEYVAVTLNGNGEVISYEADLGLNNYPAPDKKVTEEQALLHFKEEAELELYYMPIYDEDYDFDNMALNNYRLAYRLVNELPFIDAKTGESVDYWSFSKNSSKQGFSLLPAKTINRHSGEPLDEQEALAVVTGYFSIPEKTIRGQSKLNEAWKGTERAVWKFNWTTFGGEYSYPQSISAAVDADTGELIELVRSMPSFNESEISEPEKVLLTEKAARQKAIDLVLANYTDASKYLRIENRESTFTTNGQTYYSYRFNYFYKDTPVLDNYISVVFTGNGDIWDYNGSMADSQELEKKLAGIKQNVPYEKALSAYNGALGLDLMYVHLNVLNNEEDENRANEATLVYYPLIENSLEDYIVDATTGKLERTFPEEAADDKFTKKKPIDIDKHWANKQLNVIVEFGILEADESGLLHPDAELTIDEWMTMVILSMGLNYEYSDEYLYESEFGDEESPYLSALELFHEMGWVDESTITEIDAEKILTRDQLALLLMQMLDYDKLSSFMVKDQSVSSLKDAASIQNKGAVALAIKMGLLTPTGGKFNPKAPVTKAQASIILIRLANMQDKLDVEFI